jgi:hypothetical protein
LLLQNVLLNCNKHAFGRIPRKRLTGNLNQLLFRQTEVPLAQSDRATC